MTDDESRAEAAKGWSDLPREFTDPIEERRVARWHATYDAALQGLLAGRRSTFDLPVPHVDDFKTDHVDLHQFAWNCATQAHGELK